MTGFIFVDGRQPDRSTQRRMRRHVMQGKNAGRTLDRPSRLPPAEKRKQLAKRTARPCLPLTAAHYSSSPPLTSSTADPAELTLAQQLSILQRLPPAATIHSPVAMTSYAWRVIDECELILRSPVVPQYF